MEGIQDFENGVYFIAGCDVNVVSTRISFLINQEGETPKIVAPDPEWAQGYWVIFER